MRSGRGALRAIADWRAATSAGYQAAFAASLVAFAGCFIAGLVESTRYFGLAPMVGDATVLGRVLLERRDYLRALEEFRLASVIDPEHYAQDLHFALPVPEEGSAALVSRSQAQVQQNPDDARAHFALGSALLLDGDFAGSVQSLERARSLDAGLRGLLGTLGRAQLEAGALPEAERAYRAAIRSEPSNPDWRDGLGLVLYRMERPEEAGQAFESARALGEGRVGETR